MVVSGGAHRDWIANRIEACGPAQRRHARKLADDLLAKGGARVEEHALTGADLGKDRPRHHIARRQLRSEDALHEALTATVDEHRPFATQGFGGQRHRITIGRDGRGMELDELEIAQNRPRPRRQRQSRTPGTQGISGVRVKTPDPARRQHHGPAGDQDRLIAAIGSPRGAEHAGYCAICIQRQIRDAVVFHDLNRGSVPDGMDESFENTFAGSIAIGMNDPPA